MENWGLITFRTYALLLDEYGTNERKREIAATVIHEISHQVGMQRNAIEGKSSLALNSNTYSPLSTSRPVRVSIVVWEPGDDGLVVRSLAF